ncbi:MAG: hypothetical protein ABI581_07755 [Sediminibacterium sp.]
MKKIKLIIVLFIFCTANAHAQSIDPVSLIIAKVIKAIDLQVQKLQNQTIWLQQAQQLAENELSKVKLGEIADWQNKQKELYADYFQELNTVKNVVKSLPQVKQILNMQAQIVTEYNRFTKDIVQQPSFDELLLLSRDIVKSLQQVISGSTLSMKDADRAMFLCTLRDAMNECLDSIKALNKQQVRLTASKLRMQTDLQFLKKLNAKP